MHALLVLFLLTAFGLCFHIDRWRTNRLNRRFNTLLRRQCEWNEEKQDYTNCDYNLPTLDQIVERMPNTEDHGNVDAEHHALFYTNLDDPGMTDEERKLEPWPHEWMKNEGLKYYWYEDAVDWNWLIDQDEWTDQHRDKFPAYNEPPDETFASRFYQALAVAAIDPDVYFFTPKDKDWDPISAWNIAEYPALTHNDKVQRIWRVDPRPPEIKKIKPEEACKHDRPELMWARGRDAVLLIIWDCPVKPPVEPPAQNPDQPADQPAEQPPAQDPAQPPI